MGSNKRTISMIVLFLFIFSIFSFVQIVYADSLMYENGGAEFWINTTDGNNLYNSIKDNLPKLPGNVIPPKSIKGYPLNFRLWFQKGQLVYGNYNSIKDENQFRINTQPSPGVKVAGGYYYGTDLQSDVTSHGEWRYHGIDVSGNLFSNINYVDDGSGVKFDERDWVKEPWMSLPPAKKPNKSLYNKSASGDDGSSIETQSILRSWINKTLPDGIPLKSKPKDPEVYNYLNILSAPTSMQPGQGRMWHKKDDGSIWYQTLSVPILKESLQNLPVRVNIYCTNPAADLVIKDPGPVQDSQKITLNFKVIAALGDVDGSGKKLYEDPIEKTKYYTRNDIGSWTISFNGGASVNNIPTVGNQGIYEFSETVTYGYLRSKGWKEFVTATAQPTYKNTVKGNTGNGNTTVFMNRVPEPVPPVSIVPTVFTPDNNIPEVAFEDVPFHPTDSSDMGLVNDRRVFIDRVEVDDDLFFSGSYIFDAGDLGTNGRFAVVEVDYDVQGVELQPGDKVCTTDYVYIYPTKPIANFKISSNTWKQNRKIKVQDTSTAGNIQLVVQSLPIIEYEWTFGGDTSQIKIGNSTPSMKEFLCKEPGIYSATLRCRNTLGKWSDPYTVEFEVLDDIEPAVELNLADSVIARNESVKAWHYSVSSTDGDLIDTAGIELWYDSNNDGMVDAILNTWDGKSNFPVYTPTKLGYYKYIVTAKEEFGEATFSQFITGADKKSKTYEVEFWVDNYRPMSDLYINMPIQRPDIDVYFMLDKNLISAKKDYILNNRMNMANWLIGKNIIPNVNIWDMGIYTYSQPASTSKHTGSSYPSATIDYTSNGYSGTLDRTSVSNNKYSRDEGHYTTQTETKTATGTKNGYNWWTYTYHTSSGWSVTSTSGTDQPTMSYSDSQGFSGTLHKTSAPLISDNGPPSGTASEGATYKRTKVYEGHYSGTVSRQVQVWVSNIVWYNDYTGYYSGTIYKDVRQPYTDPFNPTSVKYVVYISDSTISELSDLQMVMSYAKTAKLILAGTNAIQSQIAYDWFFDVSGKPVDDVVDSILQYIGDSCPAVEKYYVLQNQAFTFNIGNLDLENDPIVSQEMHYVQNPNYFDSPTGTEPGSVSAYNNSSGWTTTVKDSFVNTGLYEIYRRVKDNPSTDPNFTQYSYYSGATKFEIYVHRKPIALATLDWDYDAAHNFYNTTWVDKSYDPDHRYNRPDKGIVDSNIMWRLAGGEWNYGIPDKLVPGTYELQYYVKDPEETWSDPYILNFTLSPAPPMQFTAFLRTKNGNFSLASVPASEFLEAFNLWTRYPFNVHLEMALYNGSTRVTPLTTVNYSTATGTKDDNDIIWNNITYQIPDTLSDRSYTYKISAIGDYAQSDTKTFTVNVVTPINLNPDLPAQIISNTTAQINASTSKYANTVQVQLFRGTSYQTTLNMSGALNGNLKDWTVNYNVPNNIPDSNYTARFTATTPNGNTETKDVTFILDSISVNASVSPNPALAGDQLLFTVNTKGYVDTIKIFVDPDIMVADNRNGKYSYPLVYSVNGAVNQKTDVLEYILCVNTAQTITKDNARLRAPYNFTVRAFKGSNYKDVILTLDVSRSVLELIHPGVKENE